MSALASTKSIGMHLEEHLVALWVCVEWRAIDYVAELFAFGELCHCELTQGLGGSERVLPGWGLLEEKGGVECHCLHSQLQAVILEVLSVSSGVVGQGGVGDKPS